MRAGLVIWLALMACSPILPRSNASAQPTSVAVGQGAQTTATSDVVATTTSGVRQATTDAPSPSPSPLQPDATTVKDTLTPGSPKLSPRLRLLADMAATSSLPADPAEQDRLLSLADSGAGSLSRDAAGKPIVDARVADTSAETIAALTALPADVLSVSPDYATVTLAIAPERLNDLANLAAVQYVSEVIRPQTNSGPNPFGELPGGGGIGPSSP
jgi:hypothetical protein